MFFWKWAEGRCHIGTGAAAERERERGREREREGGRHRQGERERENRGGLVKERGDKKLGQVRQVTGARAGRLFFFPVVAARRYFRYVDGIKTPGVIFFFSPKEKRKTKSMKCSRGEE